MITLPASDDEKFRQVRKLETGQFSEKELETALIVVPDLFLPCPIFLRTPTARRVWRFGFIWTGR